LAWQEKHCKWQEKHRKWQVASAYAWLRVHQSIAGFT